MLTKNTKKAVFLICALVFGLIVFAGCSTSKKPLQNQTMPNQGQTQVVPNGTPGGQNLSTTPGTTTTSDMERSQKISQQLTTLGGIRKAPVLVDGTTAIVGVQFTDASGKAATTSLQGAGTAAGTTSATPGTNTAVAPGNAGITAGRETGVPGSQTLVGQTNTTNQTGRGTTTENNAAIRNLRGQGTATGQGGTTGGAGTTTTSADVKTLIAQRVRTIDPTITKVLVTTDMGMVNRLQNLNNTISRDISDMTTKIQAGGGLR